MKQINYEEVLQEVRKDMDLVSEKRANIKGYAIIKQLIELVPYYYRHLITVEDDALYFDYYRLGKITNITDFDEEHHTDDERYSGHQWDKEIWVNRVHGDPLRIHFKFGKNPDNGKWQSIYDGVYPL